MRSCPVGGLMPPVSSQLKAKPNDAGALNRALSGGSCPPPTPLHAVSTTARMPTAASKMDHRRKEDAPVFIGILQAVMCEGPRGHGRVHGARDFPCVQGHVEPNRRVESGSWNTCRHHQHRHGQCRPSTAVTAVVQHQRLLRSCLPLQ
jgi:hypothetical protein